MFAISRGGPHAARGGCTQKYVQPSYKRSPLPVIDYDPAALYTLMQKNGPWDAWPNVLTK